MHKPVETWDAERVLQAIIAVYDDLYTNGIHEIGRVTLFDMVRKALPEAEQIALLKYARSKVTVVHATCDDRTARALATQVAWALNYHEAKGYEQAPST